ncbi:MAG: cysteine synthase A, partial [Campylobacteraceae bacterium]
TTFLAKAELLNPSGSVKDRISKAMIEDGFAKKLINKDSVIIEPTSGNTGIGLALVCASYGLRLILTMPSSMSIERRKLLAAYGAELVLTPPELGMKGAVNRALELGTEIKNSFIPQQFANPANPEIHRKTTAQEIIRDTDGKVDIFVAAVGTGGTITGIGEELRKINPKVKIIAVEPNTSPVLSGGKPAPHKIQGIGAGFVPEVLNTKIYDEVITVSYEDSVDTARALAKEEGILVGVSSGANIFVAKSIAAKPENKGKVIVTILCDDGDRYLSTTLFEDAQ